MSTAPAPPSKGGLAQRVISGSLLASLALVMIGAGGWPFASLACLAAWQCSREYVGLLQASGMASGMEPPSKLTSSTVTLFCVALNVWTAASRGRGSTPLAVAAFCLMFMQLVDAHKPRFAQLASTVFGLIYCGEEGGPCLSVWRERRGAVTGQACHGTRQLPITVRPGACLRVPRTAPLNRSDPPSVQLCA